MMEPFLVNPPSRRLVVFNPRRKRKRSKAKKLFKRIRRFFRRKSKAQNKGVEVKHMARRKHRRRRNPVVLGANPRRRRRHSYRRNPGIPGLKMLALPTFKQFMSLGLGALASGMAVPMIFKMVTPLGTNPFGRVATRLGVVALIGMAAKKVMRAQANDIIAGATVAQIFPIANEALAFFKLPMRLGYSEEDEMALGVYTSDEMGQIPVGQGEAEIEMGEDNETDVSISIG